MKKIKYLLLFSFQFLISFQSAAVNLVSADTFLLAGTEKGLYYWDYHHKPELIWFQERIKKIIHVSYGFFILTAKGIGFSKDLISFNYMNEGLPKKTIKHYHDSEKTFSSIIPDLKDLKADPLNPNNLVTCTNNAIYYSINSGKNWLYMANPANIPGIKTVAIYTSKNNDQVLIKILIGHSLKGIYQYSIGMKIQCNDISSGLLISSGTCEEITDILPVNTDNGLVIYAANNFTPIIYRYDNNKSIWQTIYNSNSKFEIRESLCFFNHHLHYITEKDIAYYQPSGQTISVSSIKNTINRMEELIGIKIETVLAMKTAQAEYAFTNLWLLSEPLKSRYYQDAVGKKGLYISAYTGINQISLDKVIKILSDTELNMITIDMKDDLGYLRFNPESQILKKMGRISVPIDLEKFIRYMHEKNIYLTARLVLFQDRNLYQYNRNELAVKNKNNGKPWLGIKKMDDDTTKDIQEYWVDPYSEKVWEYNIEIAKELIQRGFNEIQFDYVRFPTDGENLSDVKYLYQDPGMDKESALISFLDYARENIKAPISIDIYGANGWYRTSNRTGQDVEILKDYVDVICPMYYPSHFSNQFLYYKPYNERPYRIYYFGSLRNYYIARKTVVVRPYIQTFRLGNSYDQEYYGIDYIINEVLGVSNSINLGYTFWNMGVQYQILTKVFQKIDNTNLSAKNLKIMN